MPDIGNLVHETTQSTGSGPLTIAQLFGRQRFSSAFSTGGTDAFYVFVSHRDADEWLAGSGHLDDADTLVVDTIIDGTNGAGVAVAFSAGFKDVINDLPASRQLNLAAISGLLKITAGVPSGVTISANGESLITAANYAAMRTLLGLVIGTDVQAQDPELAAIAGLVSAADKGIHFTGVGTAAVHDLTSSARTLLAQTTQALMRTTGLGMSANGSSLVSAADYAAMKTLLGLGSADTPSFAAQVLSSASPTQRIRETGAPTDEKNWVWVAFNGDLYLQTQDDALGFGANTVIVKRTGTAVHEIQLNATLFDFNGAGDFSGALAVGGALSAASLTLGTALAVAQGGTGAIDAAGARTNLGLVIGTNVQAQDAELAALAGVTSAADKVPYFTGSGTATVADLTSVARTLLAQATQALMRTTGLGFSANGSSLVAAADYAAMKTLLGLGTGDSPQLTGVNFGHASNTTVTQESAGHLQVEANKIWDAGNDGAGSGLDADLLDGKNTGTSGNVVPLLDGANTWSAAQLNTAQPAFCAYVGTTVTNVTGDGTEYTVIFNTERFDQASNFNTGTAVFTAPVTGKYQLDAHVLIDDIAAGHTVFLVSIVTSNFTYYGYQGDIAPDATGLGGLFLSVLADMDVNDTATVTVIVSGSTKVVDVAGGAGGYSTFSGHLAC